MGRRAGNVWRMFALCALAGVLVAGLLFPVAGGLGLLSNRFTTTVNAIGAELTDVTPPLVTRVLDNQGNLIATLYDQYRLPVADSEIPNTMKAAIVAAEDNTFYANRGVDLRAILRAAINNARGGATQGGSTITQQYVKNYLVNVVDRNDPVAQLRDQEPSLDRKLREARIAIQLEQTMTKDQILAGYLNVVAFGARIFGLGAAAQVFFGTTPAQLTVPQAALLAGVVNNPLVYNPWAYPDRALERRNVVIDRMVENRSLPPSAGEQAKQAPLGVRPDADLPSSTCLGAPDYAGFFCDYAQSYLEQAGLSEDQIDTSGYTITTTLDPTVAKAAKRAVDQNVSPTAKGVANAFAVIRPGQDSHDVLAMVANRTLGTDASKGQTSTNIVAGVSNQFGGGSTYKIFTSAAALEQGTAGLKTPLPNPGSTCILPPNANRWTRCAEFGNLGRYPNPISLGTALATSPNVAFVNLEARVGMRNVLDMAYRLGLRNTMRSNQYGENPGKYPSGGDPALTEPQLQRYRNDLAFTLGFSPLSPLEMTNIVATIKSGGVWCPPNPIASVTDRDGRPVTVRALPCEQVISPGVAGALMQGLSQDSIIGTTAAAARAAGWTRPDIGKTGTTQENKSVNFVGGTGDLAVSSIVFADDSRPQPICPGRPITTSGAGCTRAFGGNTASPPYFQALGEILAGRPSPPIPSADAAFADAGSRGPIVPFVVGQPSGAAQQSLRQAGYPVSTEGFPSASPAGTVLAQTPQGNAGIGTTITLYASTGSP